MIGNLFHFYKTPYAIKKLSGNLIWNIPGKEKIIYLTFDDGPIPFLTEYVLDTLDSYHAKATFFCVGENISKYPEICRKVSEAGHRLGNHTYNHLKGWNSQNEVYLSNIQKCENLISTYQKNPGKPLFRPPYGQIKPGQVAMLKHHYKIIMWDILAYDFSPAHSGQKSLEKITEKTFPGSVVVFHDNYKAEKKLKFMLPKFLDHFTKKGYQFKKIE